MRPLTSTSPRVGRGLLPGQRHAKALQLHWCADPLTVPPWEPVAAAIGCTHADLRTLCASHPCAHTSAGAAAGCRPSLRRAWPLARLCAFDLRPCNQPPGTPTEKPSDSAFATNGGGVRVCIGGSYNDCESWQRCTTYIWTWRLRNSHCHSPGLPQGLAAAAAAVAAVVVVGAAAAVHLKQLWHTGYKTNVGGLAMINSFGNATSTTGAKMNDVRPPAQSPAAEWRAPRPGKPACSHNSCTADIPIPSTHQGSPECGASAAGQLT